MLRRVLLISVLATSYRVGCDCAWGPDAPSPDASSAEPLGLSGGNEFMCRMIRGQLSCFGRNDFQQVGTADAADQPFLVPIAGSYVQVAAGHASTCALGDDGNVYCWGTNLNGQLGIGLDAGVGAFPDPQLVPMPMKARWISHAYDHACAVAVDGTLWCWGLNLEGQLGQNDSFPGADSYVPVQVETNDDWQDVCAGQGHSCGIRDGGELYCWGRNSVGQLGIGDGGPIQLRQVTRVGTGVGYTRVVCTQQSTCALQGTNLFCWGREIDGPANREAPIEVLPRLPWTDISLNLFHMCGLVDAGAVYCFGRNIEGQLGVGDTVNPRNSPVSIDGGDWVRVAAAAFSTCAQQADGGTFCWGDNTRGALGMGDLVNRNAPVQQP